MFDFDLLLAWPDQLMQAAPHGVDPTCYCSLCLLRSGQPLRAEALLLAALASNPLDQTVLALLAVVCADLGHWSSFDALVQRLQELNPSSLPARALQAQAWLRLSCLQAIAAAGASLWRGEETSQWLSLLHASYLLKTGNTSGASRLLGLPGWAAAQSPDALMLQAQLLVFQGEHLQAIALLQPAVLRHPSHLLLQRFLLELVTDVRVASLVVPTARRAVEIHGEHPLLLGYVTPVKLLQRHPGLARRSGLMQHAWASVMPIDLNRSNLVIAYETTGHADWLPFLCREIALRPQDNFDLHSNLAMQLASVETSAYQTHLLQLVAALRQAPGYNSHRHAKGVPIPQWRGPVDRPLRIAWITGDLTPHPVSRFLLHFFQASIGCRRHHHLVVSVMDHGTESNAAQFMAIPGVEVVDVSAIRDEHRVAAIRELHADLAIDLSGWTGAHFMVGFLARMAPVQVNYLGYFASSGLLEIDYWLGDAELFPPQHSEWHTESLWRLPRPFLAWKPPVSLPEAHAVVSPPPTGVVRFGSFNNNRKLSDATLQLWAQILAAIPDALLVLKANASSDLSTQELLRRRMQRQGLDPDRVEWLPLAPTPADHLLQYGQLDIALDPIPNGGCTTTCEALWMGVPTITLAGSSYVSRMSTAVLRGAGLPDWVCPSKQAYVQWAQVQAHNLSALRGQRAQWRQRLQASPLGDAADLMQHLEHAFSMMHARAATGPSA